MVLVSETGQESTSEVFIGIVASGKEELSVRRYRDYLFIIYLRHMATGLLFTKASLTGVLMTYFWGLFGIYSFYSRFQRILIDWFNR